MNDITSNMISYLFITVFMVIFSTFGLADFNWNNEIDPIDTIKFDYDRKIELSEDGRVALHELMKSKSFSISRVGVAGRFTKEYDNFSILIQEKKAFSAFKSLIQNGTLSAQVYGLMGLNIKNPTLIEDYEHEILNSKKTIEIQSGCFSYPTKVSSFLFNNKKNNYIWLESELNKRYQWLKSNNKLFKAIGI